MFDQDQLTAAGFVGFERLLDPAFSRSTPTASGIYAVLLSPPSPCGFMRRSVGGHFKAKDPTVPIERLATKYIDGCDTMYLGRAANLKRRLGQLVRFGQGKPVGHWGGRYLWQLERHNQFRVAWRVEVDPVQAEADLLDEFEAYYGQLPFANLVRGRKPLLTV